MEVQGAVPEIVYFCRVLLKQNIYNQRDIIMKMSSLFFRFLTLILIAGIFTSCSSDLLVSKREIRKMDLVKVGAPDPQIRKNKEVVQDNEVADQKEEVLNPENQVVDFVDSKSPRSSENRESGLSGAIKRISSSAANIAKRESNTTSHSKITPESGTRITTPKGIADNLLSKSDVKEQKSNEPSINLLRLILYLLIALLIITILGMILPGRLVTIVLLVLLVVALLYLLGEI